MILRNMPFQKFGTYVKKSGKKIILFGAGTLLTSWIPYVLKQYEITDRVLLIIDNFPNKWGKMIHMNGMDFCIVSPKEITANVGMDIIILITSSYFATIIEQLDSVNELEHTECYVAPIMHITDKKENMGDFRKFAKGQMSIPKIIHYCWFGRNPMPEMNRKCIESWKKYCPDYEIVEWNERNYDVYKNRYMGQAYDMKKYGYVPDYARIDILYEHGGIYFDTDVELIRNIDDLLYLDAFASFEEYPTINFGGGSGSVKGLPILKAILDFRENIPFINRDGGYNTTTCGYFESLPLQEAGLRLDGTLQNVGGLTVLPSDYFHPKSSVTGITDVTENTYSIHQFSWSWCGDRQMEEKKKSQGEYEQILKRMQRSSRQNGKGEH